jgi:DNA-binding transcriptional LysR family regulator
MHAVHLSGVDVNLVVPLHALLEERSVASAAKRVGLSASATSHALARLRRLLDDPLLVRAGRQLVRTPRGERLLEACRRAVESLDGVFREERPFEASSMTRSFRIATTDHVQLVLLRAVDKLLAKEAPTVDLYCLPMDRGRIVSLRAGEVDFSIGVFEDVPADVGKVALFVDQLVTVVRRGHPMLRARGAKRLAAFVAYPHVLVAPIGSPTGLVDELLARRRSSRRVARTLPTFVDAALLASESDYVLTIPRTVATAFGSRFGLKLFDPTLALPRFTISLVWHRKHDLHPEHAWMKEAIVRAIRLARLEKE